eukprot:jgi/Mesen1/4973/ME000248S04258
MQATSLPPPQASPLGPHSVPQYLGQQAGGAVPAVYKNWASTTAHSHGVTTSQPPKTSGTAFARQGSPVPAAPAQITQMAPPVAGMYNAGAHLDTPEAAPAPALAGVGASASTGAGAGVGAGAAEQALEQQRQAARLRALRAVVLAYQKEAAAAHTWRLRKLQEEDEVAQTFQDEALDRYRFNAGLLAEMFSGSPAVLAECTESRHLAQRGALQASHQAIPSLTPDADDASGGNRRKKRRHAEEGTEGGVQGGGRVLQGRSGEEGRRSITTVVLRGHTHPGASSVEPFEPKDQHLGEGGSRSLTSQLPWWPVSMDDDDVRLSCQQIAASTSKYLHL